jgi:hypothetical protein
MRSSVLPSSLKHHRLSYSSQSPKHCRSVDAIAVPQGCLLPRSHPPPRLPGHQTQNKKKNKPYLQPAATEPPPRIGSRRRRPLASSPSLAVARPPTQPEPRAPRCRTHTRPPINSKHLDVARSVARPPSLILRHLAVAPARLVSSAGTSPSRPASSDSLHRDPRPPGARGPTSHAAAKSPQRHMESRLLRPGF